MKTRGIVNATRRLQGARRLGSSTLLEKAEAEAQHALTQAKAWIARMAPADGLADENYQDIVRATDVLQTTLKEAA